jgi:predicted CoA-binding protein
MEWQVIKAVANSNVAVLGASTNEERYSFMAVKALKEHGHRPIVCPGV